MKYGGSEENVYELCDLANLKGNCDEIYRYLKEEKKVDQIKKSIK